MRRKTKSGGAGSTASGSNENDASTSSEEKSPITIPHGGTVPVTPINR